MPTVPAVALCGFAFSHAINSDTLLGGNAFLATRINGDDESSATGVKSFKTSNCTG